MDATLTYIVDQLKMTLEFLAFAFACQGVNMLTGAWINKSQFSFKTFIGGLADPMWLTFITCAIVALVSWLPALLAKYNLVVVDQAVLTEISGAAVVVIAVALGVSKLKSAFSKVVERIGYKPVPVEVPVTEVGEG
jgi:hypothetical protein